MVQGNSVFIREDAKQARNTHPITYSSLLSTRFKTSLSIKQTTLWRLQEIICSRDYVR